MGAPATSLPTLDSYRLSEDYYLRRLRQRRAAVEAQLETLEAPLTVDFRVNADRLRAFLKEMDTWMRDGDVVRRKTLLRNVYRELRLWPKTGDRPWTRKVGVTANLEALTRAFVVSPTGDARSGQRGLSLPIHGRLA